MHLKKQGDVRSSGFFNLLDIKIVYFLTHQSNAIQTSKKRQCSLPTLRLPTTPTRRLRKCKNQINQQIRAITIDIILMIIVLMSLANGRKPVLIAR